MRSLTGSRHSSDAASSGSMYPKGVWNSTSPTVSTPPECETFFSIEVISRVDERPANPR